MSMGMVVHGHRDGNATGGRAWISKECLARVRAAEAAAARYQVADVLLCGAGADGFPSEARQMARAWAGPSTRLWLDEESVDTAENAQQALTWARCLGVSKLLVVSSWWHARLVVYYMPFREVGISVRHVRSRRCERILSHLGHELRYLPRALLTAGRCIDMPCPRRDEHLLTGVPCARVRCSRLDRCTALSGFLRCHTPSS
jgi:hypothetical protein